MASDFLSFSHSATHSHSLTLSHSHSLSLSLSLTHSHHHQSQCVVCSRPLVVLFSDVSVIRPLRGGWRSQLRPPPWPPRRLYQLPPHSRGGVWGGYRDVVVVVAPTAGGQTQRMMKHLIGAEEKSLPPQDLSFLLLFFPHLTLQRSQGHI